MTGWQDEATNADLTLLTVDDVCALMKVKSSWLYDMVEAGEMPHVRLGRQLRFRPADIAGYIKQHTIQTPSTSAD